MVWIGQTARDVIRFQNDFNAGVQNDHADKFTCGFVVQPLHMEDALNEIKRCTSELGMSLLCLPTHYINGDGQWTSVSDESVTPIWELADELGLAVEIHPYDADKIVGLKNIYWRFHLVWMCALTADTYHVFTLRDIPGRYPNVRTCFAHGNQFAQVNYGRRQQGFEGRPDLFEGYQNPKDYAGHSNVYFDTLVHDPEVLKLLIQRQGVAQIVAGLDDPYPLGEMDTVKGCYPGKVIDDARDLGYITEKEVGDIWHTNVLNWLGK